MRLFSRPVAALAVMTGLFAATSPVGAHAQTAHADEVISWPSGHVVSLNDQAHVALPVYYISPNSRKAAHAPLFAKITLIPAGLAQAPEYTLGHSSGPIATLSLLSGSAPMDQASLEDVATFATLADDNHPVKLTAQGAALTALPENGVMLVPLPALVEKQDRAESANTVVIERGNGQPAFVLVRLPAALDHGADAPAL